MKKFVVGSIILVLVTLGWSTRVWGNRRQRRGGNCGLWIGSPRTGSWIALNVFEHLVELDKDGKLVPTPGHRLAVAR